METLAAKTRKRKTTVAAYDSKRRRRRRRRSAADDLEAEDRISQLPEPILHHILGLLSQKEAIQTCVLSKAWRYLGCTRPEIDFRDGCTVVAGENKEPFLSVLDRTLRCYVDRKLQLPEVTLHLGRCDCETVSFLRKWILLLVWSMGVNQFHLHFIPIDNSSNFKIPLPLSIFRSESLQNLSLKNFVLKSFSALPSTVHLKHLQKLTLDDVDIPEQVLDDILSSCRLVEYVSLTRCTGFKSIKLKHPASLKEFCFDDHQKGATSIAMGDGDIPTLRTVVFQDCLLSVNRNHKFYFSHLTHLTMKNVTLSSSSDFLFSCSLPCLEKLSLYLCSGIKEFNLSSRSMKQMDILNMDSPFKKVTIDAPSIVRFHYCGVLPQSISFSPTAATTWESNIDLTYVLNESSLCLLDLIGLLKAVSRSKISIKLDKRRVRWLWGQLHLHLTNFGVPYADLPVAVVKVFIDEPKASPSAVNFFRCLFLMIRPRSIYTGSITKVSTVCRQLRELADLPQRILEAVSRQSFYWNGGVWQTYLDGEEFMDLPVEMERKIKLIIYN